MAMRVIFGAYRVLSWVGLAGFSYIVLAPLIGEGAGHVLDGLYAALFFRKDAFAWANGTVMLVSLLYLAYSANAVLPARWKHYPLLADLATLLALVYINLNVYQLKLIMIPLGLWYVAHRWVAHSVFKIR
jgi:hypothetical protein